MNDIMQRLRNALDRAPDADRVTLNRSTIESLLGRLDAEWDAALVAAADRLGHGYINTDHLGDTLFACNVVLDMRRKTEAE